jgi:TolB-like protein/tetratricopeptide (TPR) repeat protein
MLPNAAGTGARAHRRTVAVRALLLGAVGAAAWGPRLLAQCPDGTPPPCAGARARAAAHAPPPAAERGRRFLILPFRNLSRSPELEWLVEGSTTMLADALSRWQEITVVPDERLYPALRRAGLSSGAVMDPVRVRRVAEETAGWTAVTGEVLATGGRVRVSARAYDVVTGRELVRATDDVPAGGDVRPAFERIGTRLLRTASLDTANVDLGAATTRSLDAYRAYLRGVAFVQRAQYRRAREALLEAVRLDSTFAKPYVLLAISSLFISPMSAFDPQSAGHRYAARAVQLGAQLRPADRDYTVALNAIFEAQFTAARRTLERLVAADSNNINAVGLLSMVEYSDPLLAPVGGGERPRGSLNRNNRLARRVLELDPAGHAAFIPLIYSHLLAAGDMPGLVIGVRREAGSFQAMFLSGGVRFFVPILRDSFELIPAESLATLPAESLAAARQRALGAARDLVDRWLTVGPAEAEAHVAAAKVSELLGEWERALRELRTADSLGVEAGLTCTGCRRLALLGKLGRYDEAQRIALNRWAHVVSAVLLPVPTDETEAFAWMFNLFLMRGDFARADTALGRLTAGLMRMGVPDTTFAAGIAIPLAGGSPVRPTWQLELPLAFRAGVMDSVWTRREQVAPQSRVGRALPTLQRLVSAAVTADSALAARVRAAPWYLAPR